MRKRALLVLLATVLTLVPAALADNGDVTPDPPEGVFSLSLDDDGQVIVFVQDQFSTTHDIRMWIGIGEPDWEAILFESYNLVEDGERDFEANGVFIPTGLVPDIGTYVAYMEPTGPGGPPQNDPDGDGWVGPQPLVVTEPPPMPSGDFSVRVNEFGSVIVTLNDPSRTDWVQVWVGLGDPLWETRHIAWYDLANQAVCTVDVCEIDTMFYPGYGTFAVYIQPWGPPIGFARNDLSGWFGAQQAIVETQPPAIPTGLETDTSTGVTLNWQAPANALFYQVWVGTVDPLQASHFEWHSAESLGCAGGGQCSLDFGETLLGGQGYQWYVQAWGPGGTSTGGEFQGWAEGQPFTAPEVSFMFGGHVADFKHPDLMRDAGMGWVKRQLTFNYGESLALAEAFIQNAEDTGFGLVLSIKGNRDQLGADAAAFIPAYAEYVGQVAAAMTNGGAIEVWNEPNIDREWPTNQISGAAYTALLQAAYQSIKAANPDVMVISAGLAPTGAEAAFPGQVVNDDNFLQQMKDAGAVSSFDCLGVHYNEGIVPPTQTSGDPRSEHYSRYYPAMVELYSGMFPTKPLCFTELGYLTGEGIGTLPPAFAWAENTTLAEQAAWLAQAAELSRDNPLIRMMVIWNVDFDRFDDDPMAGYAIVRPDGTCPACPTLGTVFNAN